MIIKALPPIPLCRRCSVCDGLTHHWLPQPEDRDPPRYDYVCKHCSVIGVSCMACPGDDDADAGCAACHGEGVLQLAGMYYVDPEDEDEEL